MDQERIAKVLARAGIASRREAERIIEAGRVSVNGRVIDSPALNVSPGDRVAVDNVPLPEPEAPRIWLYHKPPGRVTTARDEKGRPTVFDDLPPEMPRVMTVGRLDLNSEGLLLLTNDGGIKRRLELPATGWTRKYRVRVKGSPSDESVEPLRKGLVIDGERFRPMTVSIDRQQGANAWLTVAIREGRNREVRRAMEAVGLTVNRLIRVGYGPFRLGDLAAGAIEEVKPRIVREQLGLARPDPGAGGTARPGPAKKGGPRKAAPPKGPRTPRGDAGQAEGAPGGASGRPARARRPQPGRPRPAGGPRKPR